MQNSFTVIEMIQGFLWLCGAIVAVAAAVAVIVNLVNKTKEPNAKQDNRLLDIERRLAKHDELLSIDKKRLEKLEEGNRVTQRAILALLSHGIDGNNVDDMKKAKHELEEYLLG